MEKERESPTTDQPSRWQQLFGRSRPKEEESLLLSNQVEANEESTWVDVWEREKMLATIDPTIGIDDTFDGIQEDLWPVRSNDNNIALTDLTEARKCVRARFNVEERADQIKRSVKEKNAVRYNQPIFAPRRQADPAVDPVKTIAERQARLREQHQKPSHGVIVAPRPIVRIQNSFQQLKISQPAVDVVRQMNARHERVQQKRSARLQAAQSVAPPPPPVAPITQQTKHLKQDQIVTQQLAREAEHVAEMSAALRKKHNAVALKQEAFATWWSQTEINRTMRIQATRLFTWRLERRVWDAWRMFVRHAHHQRAIAHAEATTARKHRLELVAAVHARKKTLFRAFSSWVVHAVRARAAAKAEAKAAARRAYLLAIRQAPPQPQPPFQQSHVNVATSPTVARDAPTYQRHRAWKEAATRVTEPPRANHAHVGTSPLKAKVKIIRRPADPPLPSALVDMATRQAQRKERWEALQLKYKQAQDERAEMERAMAEAAQAEIERQKQLTREKQRELKREAERQAQEQERRRQLAREQRVLATQHYTRCLVLHRGIQPWKKCVEQTRYSTRQTWTKTDWNWQSCVAKG
ncbi:hypothetical protein AC1031_015208 [Aphanomyces cochlioides]|nr:hypothetical protein AC1031_015208 [Aphanomyces cochlioides]